MRTYLRIASAVLIALLLLGLLACGQGSRRVPTMLSVGAQQAAAPAAVEQQVTWPEGLPEDKAQPWEELDADGYVVPPKGTSNLNFDSIFASGIERYLEAGDVTDFGEASSFASGAPGGEAVSYAIYRLALGAEKPGTITADVNVHSGSAYYIGVGDYSVNTWHWYGPYSTTHVRFNVPEAEYTSGLGNLMLAVVAYDGASFDVVAIGANARDAADTEAPPAPDAPILTPVAGGVFAEWLEVAVGDLAGYRIYADGEPVLDYIEGGTSVVIPAASEVEVTLSAVDISGNESGMSDPATGAPLAGEIPPAELSATAASGLRNDTITLTATGAETYDWDLDGDGVWDFTDDPTDTRDANTENLGVIRPAIRAHTADGGFSLSAVSLFITGNFRPVVLATADVTSGPPPLDVNFTIVAEDDDGTIDEYAWDFDGDGTFDDSSPTDPSPLAHSYASAGMFNAKFRATDDDGAWAIDTVAVQVIADPSNIPPVAILTTDEDTVFRGISGDWEHVTLDASSSYDPEGTTLQYAWDPDGDGNFGAYAPDATYDYGVSENPRVIISRVRVQDEGGAISEATCQVNLYRYSVYYANSSDTNEVGTFPSLANVGGMPAVAHYDYTDDLLLYSVATSLPATSEDCWETHVVDDGGDGPGGTNVGWRPSLVVVGGLPAIAYYDSTNSDLKFARANTLYPNSSSDWAIHVVDSTGNVGDYPSMTSFYEGFIMGTRHTVIAYYDTTNTALKVARATGIPNSTGDWSYSLIDNSGSVGRYTSITAISDGNLISPEYGVGICYYDASNDNLKWALSAAWPPTIWSVDVIDDGGGANNVGMYTAMNAYSSAGILGGQRFPLVTYYDDTNDDLKFARATVAYPTAGDWVSYTLEDGGTDYVGQSSSVIWYHGEPMVLYNNGSADELWLARAMNSAPADEIEWWKHLVAVNFDPMMYRVPLIEFEDKPIFAAFSNTSPPPRSNLNFGWPVLY